MGTEAHKRDKAGASLKNAACLCASPRLISRQNGGAGI